MRPCLAPYSATMASRRILDLASPGGAFSMQISDNPALFADEGRSDLAYAARYRGGCSCKVRRQDIVLSTELTNSRDRDPLQRADEVPGSPGGRLPNSPMPTPGPRRRRTPPSRCAGRERRGEGEGARRHQASGTYS